MYSNIPKEVILILNTFTKAGYQIYIVGGAVRDLLMHRQVNDWDFTTDAKPEEILKLFPEGFYDNKFGTVGITSSVIANPKRVKQSSLGDNNTQIAASSVVLRNPRNDMIQVYEITTMRKEGDYRDFRHPVEISWTNKVEEDLARRDFTINAMALYCHPQTDKTEIVDPFNGQQDLQNRIIRAVGNPTQRFQEDALRLLRAIRIATQLQFDIEPNTFQAIQDNAHLIKEIANERIREELFKLLSSEKPYEGIIKLRQAGILQIILPELELCFGLQQEGPKHDRVYDIGEHSLESLKYCDSTDPLVRFATLLHDVGKPDTVQIQPDGNVTFYNHDIVGGKIIQNIAKRFNMSKKQTDKLYRLVRWHLFTVDENQTDSAIRRFIRNVGLENIDNMMALRIGDRLGGGTQKAVSWRMKKFRERIDQVLQKPFSITDLKVNGNDVMNELHMQPGPKVGEILQQLFEEVLEDSAKNNREYLLKKIKEYS